MRLSILAPFVALAFILLVAVPAQAGVWSDYLPYTIGASSSSAPTVSVTNTGLMGIGGTSPISLLHVEGAQPSITIKKKIPYEQVWQFRNGQAFKEAKDLDIYDYTSKKAVMTFKNGSGNVYIGTSTNYLGNSSRLFVWGGQNGANVDVMGDPSIVGGDQATIDIQSSTFPKTFKSVFLQYQNHGLGSSLGFPNKEMGKLVFNADTNLIYTQLDKPLIFGTDSEERMRLDKAGNLGIGTKAPQSVLHVSKGANATTTITIGELNITSSRSCVNMNRIDGGPGSFYLNDQGALISEPNYCR